LLVEEPESRQNPSGLAKTLNVFLALVKGKDVQVFITTYSIELPRLLKGVSEEKGRRWNLLLGEGRGGKEGFVEVWKLAGENVKVLEEMGSTPLPPPDLREGFLEGNATVEAERLRGAGR